jgi:cyclophilin family peptidyl-prolyl cis-trans isomerase
MGTNKRARKKENRKQRLDQMARQSQRRRQRSVGMRIAIVLAIIVGIAGIFSVSGDETTQTTDSTVVTTPPASTPEGRVITGETPCPAKDGSEERAVQFDLAPPACIEPGVTYTAMVKTNKGDFSIVLDPARAPLAVNNFVVLARYKYYDSTNCHRAISNFVVQCGDPTATGSGGPGYQFGDELPAAGEYVLGSIAMANSGPNTNGSQFFIITGDDGINLPPNYTLFGQVTDGLDTTVPALNAAGNPDPVANGVPPSEPLVIESVIIIES